MSRNFSIERRAPKDSFEKNGEWIIGDLFWLIDGREVTREVFETEIRKDYGDVPTLDGRPGTGLLGEGGSSESLCSRPGMSSGGVDPVGRPALFTGDERRVSFAVYGIPKPKGSARGYVVMKAGKARAIVTSDNKSLKSWEHAVRDAAQSAVGQHYFTEAVRLEIDFWFPRPKSVSAKKRPHFTTKPDLSKLVRGAEDALIGVLFKDDSQIIALVATKRYVDGPAGARVTVTEI